MASVISSRDNRDGPSREGKAVVVCETCHSAVEDLGFCTECGEVWVKV